MALNAKVGAEIDRQIAAGKMPAEYGAKLKEHFASEASDEFQAGFLANAEYQREMNRLKKSEAEWLTWKETSQKTLDENVNALTAAQAKIAEYETKIASGDLSMEGQNALLGEIKKLQTRIDDVTKNSTFITQEMLDKKIKEASGGLLNFVGNFQDQQRGIDEQNVATFGKPLTRAEHQELIEFASEQATKLGRNVQLEEAYSLKMKDKIKEAETTKMRAEIEKEYQTKYGVPGAGGPGGGAGGGSGESDRGPLQELLSRERGAKDGLPADGGLQESKAKAVDLLRVAGV